MIKEVLSEAREKGETALLVTFDRHPLSVLKPGFSPKLLSTLDEKLDIFDSLGVDITCVMHFTRGIAGLTAEQFIREFLLGRLNMGTLIAGYDHGFGKKRENSTEVFEKLAGELHYSFKKVDPVKLGGGIVKSSTIRARLEEGDVELASELLGADYSIKGRVIRGNTLGRTIGIPTANIEPVTTEKILPASGVYAGWVSFWGAVRKAVVNLGPRPTFNIEKEAFETHLIDFDGDLYGKEVRAGFTRRLRDIRKFDTHEELKQQITSDIEQTKNLIIL
jgi:riboflavin kinase/FMN adenylyltransferase